MTRAPASGVFTYGYDGDGRRVTRSLYGMNFVYLYDAAGQLKAEYRNGALLKEFVHAGGKLLAVEDATQGREYLTTDHLGSTRVVTDATGVVKSRHDYLPFGKEVPVSLGGRHTVAGYAEAGTTFQPTDEHVLQRFTGKELDPETGLDYFGARYYSGRQGRFTSPDEFPGGVVNAFTGEGQDPGPLPYADTTNPQSLNKYAYVLNNPLRYVDPNGHCIEDLCVAEAFLVATAATATVSFLQSPRGQEAIRATGLLITLGLQKVGSLLFSKSDEKPNPQSDPAAVSPARPGTLGLPDHQLTAQEEAKAMDGKTEVTIKTPGGEKKSRRADAANIETGGKDIVQVIRPTPAGNIPKREQSAARDIEQASKIKPRMVPVRPLRPPKPKPEEPE